jgi:hypothetical protein
MIICKSFYFRCNRVTIIAISVSYSNHKAFRSIPTKDGFSQFVLGTFSIKAKVGQGRTKLAYFGFSSLDQENKNLDLLGLFLYI